MTSASLFTPLSLPGAHAPLVLSNRIVVAPMCQYAAQEGCASDWHLMHWGNLLNSGAALFTIEATAVLPEGRITPACLGLWDERTEAALGRTLERARALAPHTPVCIQLAHAGRKASSALPWQGGQWLAPEHGGWDTWAPSALAHLPHERAPQAMDAQELVRVRQAFVRAARRSAALGLEAIEVHAAHGYLLHEFLSPLSNQRQDAYGGDLQGRMRFVLEVFDAMRQAFDGSLGIRISATDWVDGGWDVEQSCVLAQELAALGCNLIHVSSAGLSPRQQIALAPLYQVPFAQAVRATSGLVTTAVGLITTPEQAEGVVRAGQADLVALGRAFLYDPRWGWHAAAALGAQVQAHRAYWRCPPREAGALFGATVIGTR